VGKYDLWFLWCFVVSFGGSLWFDWVYCFFGWVLPAVFAAVNCGALLVF
jgi:hypothetical protein